MFECRQFASIFVGVMPLSVLRILEIHSYIHELTNLAEIQNFMLVSLMHFFYVLEKYYTKIAF